MIDLHEQWFKKELKTLENELQTNFETGLSVSQAKKRLQELGPNKLAETEKESLWTIFSRQFEDFMVIVLMISTAISALLGEVTDAIAILAIIVLNAVLGFVQEYRAEKSLDALKNLTAPVCRVIRQGKQQLIEASQLVPGDIILLAAGDRIPADARLITANSLFVNEAMITGESVPSEKDPNYNIKHDLVLGDQLNMLFMGTLIIRGRAKAIVVATGMETEIGKIAGMIQDSVQNDTPLQQRLEVMSKWLVAACLAIVGLVFVAGVLQGFDVYKMFMTGVSLAVAAIPEGLPAVVTIALAVGVQRMIKRNAIIRQLPAVETLGCATVICSDKTGTLTQNQMHVQKFYLAGEEIDATNVKQLRQSADSSKLLKQALVIGAVCNNTSVEEVKEKYEIIGDPTEAALVIVARQAGLIKERLLQDYQVIGEIPFDSERKRMSVLVKENQQLYSFVKGAPGIVLDRCSFYLTKDGIQPLTGKVKLQISKAIENFGEQALRVLGFAYKIVANPQINEQVLESELIFVGFVGMMDLPRPEAKRAIAQAKEAGIKTIMVTGDHKITAAAIAKQLGLGNGRPQVMTGLEWEALTEVEQQQRVKDIDVFARVAPQHKLSIVRALQKNGEIVGMTGDGVNDAPAVKEADIGISMGISGTDVTKEASDMVLADDNFQTIIAAIEEGRAIYDNIRKFIRYLLTCNVGEVLTMLIATLAGLPLPLLPIQILWMNLVTDGLPAIALGVDPGEQDIMQRPPRDTKEGIFSRRLHLKIGLTGILISICTIAVFIVALINNPTDLTKARTLAFTTLVMAQLIFVFECRSEHHSIFEIGIFGNLYLVGAVFISSLMHCLIVYHPLLQNIFKTTRLTVEDWLLVLIFGAGSLVMDTVVRLLKKQFAYRFAWVRVRN